MVVDAAEEALVLDVPLLGDRVLEGARLQVELGRGEAIVGSYFFSVLVSRFLRDELPVARGVGVENVHDVKGSEVAVADGVHEVRKDQVISDQELRCLFEVRGG